MCKEISKEDSGINIKIGIIGTADKFLADEEEAKIVGNLFDVDCVEMEGAAIAQVCYLNNLPFLVIRGISDVMNGNNKIDFNEFLESSSIKTCNILKKILQKF